MLIFVHLPRKHRMSLEIYSIGADGYRAWAYGYRPFENMRFLDEFSPEWRERRREFERLNPGAPGLAIDERGTSWPDVLGCGGGPMRYFFSKRVVDSLLAHGIDLWRVTEIPMGEILSKKLRKVAAPSYFIIETEPGIEVDWEKSGVSVDGAGKPISHPYPKPWPRVLEFRMDTWSGKDIFTYANYGTRLTLLCTAKVKQIAMEERWKGATFDAVGGWKRSKFPPLPPR